MAVTGIIFSNIHDNNIPELTRLRTIASVPFGCRYRFIDFTLSNMVNANIFNIDVITQSNYQSLMDHLGSGKSWDLDRKNDGLFIFSNTLLGTAEHTNAKSFASNMEEVANVIENQRLSVSSVDTNEEAASLVMYQNGYNLACKVLSVMNEVYDKLINQTG